MMANAQPEPGKEIGGYRITGRLGHGAMAEVYDAIDATGHRVALKVFRAGGGVSPTMLERFRREAEAAKKLRQHPNVLTVYATGREDNLHFIAMERIENSRTLETLISGGASVADLLQVTIKVASALHYAHERKVIHRDVKPSNIMLDDFKEPLLTDFGVAELTDWPSVTLSGALTGTPIYMSPEQARTDKATAAADVYSLAVVLYEALTGELPYELPEAPSTALILEAVKHQAPIRPRKLTKRIGRDLEFVLLKALRKNADERYQTAREFAYDLEAVLEGRAVTGRWVSPWTGTSRWFQRNRSLVIGGVSLVLLASAALLEFRERLWEVRFRSLITAAVSASNEQKLANMETNERAGPEMRSARGAMALEKWIEARDRLQVASRVYRDLGQNEALAEALLERARCEVMLYNSLRAREVYLELLNLPEAGSIVRQLAAFELQILLLLDGDREEARALLDRFAGEDEAGAYTLCMRKAQGLEPASWAEQSAGWSFVRLRSHAVIAEVVGARGHLPPTTLKNKLIAGREAYGDENVWPLPFIEYILGRL